MTSATGPVSGRRVRDGEERSPSQCRRRPSIMLVRMDERDEAALGLDQLPVRILRVRHALPACHRMRIVHPEIVLVGRDVAALDLPLLLDSAFETAAGILHIALNLDAEAVRAWVARTVDIVRERRGPQFEAA